MRVPVPVLCLFLSVFCLFPSLPAHAGATSAPRAAGVSAKAVNAVAPSAVRMRILREAGQRQTVVFTPDAGNGGGYTASGPGFRMALGKDGMALETISAASPANVGKTKAAHSQPIIHTARVEFVGANPAATVTGLDPVKAKFNYFLGHNPADWRTNVPAYSRVKYTNLYPGIDLIYYAGRSGRIEYDLVVAPGADPSNIRFRVSGDQPAALTKAGNLQLDGPSGAATLMRPMLYQDAESGKKAVVGSFVEIAKNEYGFVLAKYNHAKPLVIDPTIKLLYSTYMGGTHDDATWGMYVDAAGDAYITGYSVSQDFPITANAYQQVRKAIGTYTADAVIMEFDPSGTLLYSTFLGGTENDVGFAIAVDSQGNAWVGGVTTSDDFPVTANAYQSSFNNSLGSGDGVVSCCSGDIGSDAFLAEISADGSSLLYSTYMGGPGNEFIGGLLINQDGSLWVAGGATEAAMTASANAYEKTPGGTDGYFIAKVIPTAAPSAQAPYLTYFGGGTTTPSTPTGEGPLEAFAPTPLATDSAGNVYLAAASQSSDFPATANAFEKPIPICNGFCYGGTGFITPSSEPFVAKFNPDLSQLLYASEIGGTYGLNNGEQDLFDYPVSIHLDSQGNIWMVGTTNDEDFPVTSNAVQRSLGPPSPQNPGTRGWGPNYFISEVSADGSKLIYGSYLGGLGSDRAGSATWDSKGDIWIAGYATIDPTFPVTAGAIPPPVPMTQSSGAYATITELSPDGTQMLYSTLFGGGSEGEVSANNLQIMQALNSGFDTYNFYNPYNLAAIGVDSSGSVHLVGTTLSTSFPVTDNALQSQFANGDHNPDNSDMFYSILGTGAIGAVSPMVGGNTGDTTVTVNGAGFQPGATCTLVDGGTSIQSSAASVSANGNSITCMFALSGAAAGSYAVNVNDPDGTTVSGNSSFTVENGGAPDIWVNVVGRPAIRTGVPSNVVVTYGNSGNVDAYFVPLTIYLPPHLSASYKIGIAPGVMISGDTANTSSNGSIIPLFLPHVAAGTSGSFVISIQDDTANDNYTVAAGYGHPWYTSVSAAMSDLSAASRGFTSQPVCAASASGQPDAGSCLGPYLTGLQAGGLTTSQVEGVASSMTSLLVQSQVGPAPKLAGTTIPASSLNIVNGGTLVVTKVPATANQVIFSVTDVSKNFIIPVTSANCPPDGGVLSSGIKTLTCTFPNIPAPLNQVDVFEGAAQTSGGYQGLGDTAEFDVACFGTTAQVTTANFSVSAEGDDCGDLDDDEPEEPEEEPEPPEEPEPQESEPVNEGDPSATNNPFYVPNMGDGNYDYQIVNPQAPQNPGSNPPSPPEYNTQLHGGSVHSVDPNGIVGPNGDGSAAHYIRGTAALSYQSTLRMSQRRAHRQRRSLLRISWTPQRSTYRRWRSVRLSSDAP